MNKHIKYLFDSFIIKYDDLSTKDNLFIIEKTNEHSQEQNLYGYVYYPERSYNNHRDILLNAPGSAYHSRISRNYKIINDNLKLFILSKPKSFLIINCNHPILKFAIKDIINEYK